EVAKDHAQRTRTRAPLKASSSLGYWAGLHATVGALGLMRKPVELNRNQAATGSWTFAAAT
ncbi:MAG: hypothetical protein JSV06_00450, partial [Myxococcales bacterium]